MFASQLLRILQIIPADVNDETGAFNTPKQKFTMTENQIGIIYDSNSYEKDADRLSFSTSEALNANFHGENPNSLAFAIEDGDDFWTAVVSQSPILDNSTKRNGTELGGSPVAGDQTPSRLNGFEKDAELFAFDANDKDEIQISPEDVFSMIDDQIANCNENESKESQTSSSVPQPFESDWNPFMDKNVLECDLPEFVICNKESNIQVVKDICIDEGVRPEDKILTESDKFDHACSTVLQSADEDAGTTTNDPDIEFFVPDGFKPSSLEDIDHNAADEFWTEEIEETRTTDDGSEKVSYISSARVSEEFILQEAVLESSKLDENKAEALPDEVPSLEAVLESLAVAFTPAQSKKDGPVSNVGYNSKVGGRTITFDFNSSKPAVTSTIDRNAEPASGNAPETEDEKPKGQLASSSAQLANSEEKIKENASDPNPLKQDAHNDENEKSGHLSSSSHFQRGEGESSFSTSSVPVSGLITYSGPIAYSASTSLRSDSSTTSTRSFAFPVLQTEWNSSPVRMEKARKQKGWKHGILCCRF